MTKEEVEVLVKIYEDECEGSEYDCLDAEHLKDFLIKHLGNTN